MYLFVAKVSLRPICVRGMPQDRFNGVSTFENNEPAFPRSPKQLYSELLPTKEATFHDVMTLVERYVLSS